VKYLNHEILSNESSTEWVVFIHGAGGNLNTWKYQVPSFADSFNILLIDLRDHGSSKNILPEYKTYTFDIIISDICKLLDHLSISKANFISLSMGSMILQKLALARPDLINSAIFAGGVFKVNWKIMAFANLAFLMNKILPYRWMYLIFSLIVMPRKNHQKSRQVYIEQSKQLRPSEYQKWIGLYKEFRRVLNSYYFKSPEYDAMIIMGSQDHIFLEPAKAYHNYHSKTYLEIIPDCGHICNIEQPDAFNKLALKFLNEKVRRVNLKMTGS
jgi:pimeloyl-ACP methyl ester carboxylesterase